MLTVNLPTPVPITKVRWRRLRIILDTKNDYLFDKFRSYPGSTSGFYQTDWEKPRPATLVSKLITKSLN